MKFNLLDSRTNQELLTWYDTITKQNYFTKENNIIIQNDVLVMGASSSGILSEIVLQYVEALHVTHLTKETQDHKLFPLGR
jgi:hypothetical protein